VVCGVCVCAGKEEWGSGMRVAGRLEAVKAGGSAVGAGNVQDSSSFFVCEELQAEGSRGSPRRVGVRGR